MNSEREPPNLSNVFEIRTNDLGDLILLHKPDNREFFVDLPVSKKQMYKFKTYGFGSLNAREIIMDLIRSYRFEYSLYPTYLDLEFDIVNTKGERKAREIFRCEEVFDMRLEMSAADLDRTVSCSTEAKHLITVLYNKIRNLEGTIHNLEKTLEWEKDCYFARVNM